MLSGDMRDLVANNGCQLILALSHIEHSSVNANLAAWQCKRISLVGAEDRDFPLSGCRSGYGSKNVIGNTAYVAIDRRVLRLRRFVCYVLKGCGAHFIELLGRE
jgi:hypothetical protein